MNGGACHPGRYRGRFPLFCVAVLNSLFLLWLFLEDELVKCVSISALLRFSLSGASYFSFLYLKSQNMLHLSGGRFQQNYGPLREDFLCGFFLQTIYFVCGGEIYTALQATRLTNLRLWNFTTPSGVVLPEPLFFFSVPLCLCGK